MMIKKILYLFFTLLIFGSNAYAQSAAAYENAGDQCMKKHDALSAVNFYCQSLAYKESPELFLKMGNAYRDLQDFEKALLWYNKSLVSLDPSSENYFEASFGAADMLKRTGKFTEAENQIKNVKTIPAKDSIRYHDFISGLHKTTMLINDTLPYSIHLCPSSINSPYSDFAPFPSGDSVLYFSSMKFTTKSKDNKKLYAKILENKLSKTDFNTSTPLETVNQVGRNSANMCISPDGKFMLFTKCDEDENGNFICSLFESDKKSGKWQTPFLLKGTMNVEKYTSTQPSIATNREEGYVIYFSSDRPGGEGGNDIWIAKRNAAGNYSDPVNAGKNINTRYNEMTPFYDVQSDTLYFSSDRYDGLGGLDIFAVKYTNKIPGEIISFGPPVNSGYNDLYMIMNYSVSRQRYIVSNRPPAQKLNGISCCYDIFQLDNLPPAIKKDTAQIANINLKKDSVITDSLNFQSAIATVAGLKLLLPLRLFFDNDFPDPKTRNATTTFSFENLVGDYLRKQTEYEAAFTSSSAKSAIKNFFIDSVQGNYEKLETFTNQIYHLLNSGKSLNLKIRGHASPLAESSYNVTLSSRRISSLKNYWQHWNNGALQKFLSDGQLKLEEEPSGESLAKKNVSDNIHDKSSSVYSPDAAEERRIEVTEITLH